MGCRGTHLPSSAAPFNGGFVMGKTIAIIIGSALAITTCALASGPSATPDLSDRCRAAIRGSVEDDKYIAHLCSPAEREEIQRRLRVARTIEG